MSAPLVLPLAAAGTDARRVGSKAANLSRLMAAGFHVPDGFVITTDASRHRDDGATTLEVSLAAVVLTAVQDLRGGALAVRSSSPSEDQAEASFAGQYETRLGVQGMAALEAAILRCWKSAFDPRANAYRSALGADGAAPGIAVLVQKMVEADAAGVAFTANPVTGERSEVVVSVVRGVGERLVSGEVLADEWLVQGVTPVCHRAPEGVFSAEQVMRVAALARRIEAVFGAPQDVEWALAGDRLFVLQARPMTALPKPAVWQSPPRGGWMRNFRMGEWLPEPVTSLCDTWLLTAIEQRFALENRRDAGFMPRPPLHVLVNGWYFHSPVGTGSPGLFIQGFLRRPRLGLASLLVQSRPDWSDRLLASTHTRRWRETLLPRYRDLVEAEVRRVNTLSPEELIGLVDRVAAMAGEYLWSMAMVGGFAWKAEGALARFYRRHLHERIGGSHQELLVGLSTPSTPPHAVESVDWYRPTLGELASVVTSRTDHAALRARIDASRRATEATCRRALAGRPRLRERFEVLLRVSQKYAALREEQFADFTLGWPVMRQAVLRLGTVLVERTLTRIPEDVFFLTRTELQAGLVGSGVDQDLSALVWRRRKEWQWQRRLTAPLVLGTLPGFMKTLMEGTIAAMRSPGTHAADVVHGMPASPGRISGPVRLLRSPNEIERLRPGEVLVAPITTPAWAPLLASAAAVVTDGGSVAAHASLIAREYGIPAVVATGDATARLRDGQLVTVDGSAGVVEVRT